LQQACVEEDHEKAENLIKTYGLTLNNGLLQQTYDERGYRYDLPPFVINPAVKYGETKIITKVQTQVKSENLELTFRAAGCNDCNIMIKTDENIAKIKEKYKEKNSLKKEIRLFFNGKEMKDQTLLGQYPVSAGFVIQVFIKP
jgi:hypothetical protein